MDTPFTFGRTVRESYFTNRETECKKLRSNFEHNINTVLISPRRWGKSSLVEKVAEQVHSSRIKVVKIDLFGVRHEEEFFQLLSTAVIKCTSTKVEEWVATAKRFLKQVSPKFTMGIDPGQEFEVQLEWESLQKNYRELLELPEKLAKEKKIRIVICIDEFQNIGTFDNPTAFQKRLRSVWQHQQHVCYCLYGSKRHMMINLFEKQSMPFYRFGESMYLQKITAQNWVKHITKAFERTKKSITPEQAATIAEKVKCHPYYVQQLAHLVWTNTTKKVVTETITYAITELLTQNAILYYKETEDLSATQLNFMKAVASGASAFSSKETIKRFNLGTSANVNKIKETLLTREVIDIQMGKIEFIDPAYELWFKKQFAIQ